MKNSGIKVLAWGVIFAGLFICLVFMLRAELLLHGSTTRETVIYWLMTTLPGHIFKWVLSLSWAVPLQRCKPAFHNRRQGR